jgi:hypothetical protein
MAFALTKLHIRVTQLTKETAQPVTNFRDFIVNATGAYLTVGYQGARVSLALVCRISISLFVATSVLEISLTCL